MAMPKEAGVPGLTNLGGAVVDGGKTVLLQQTLTDGRVVELAMPGDTMARAVTFMIDLAREAALQFAGGRKGEHVQVNSPIEVASLGVAKGRDPHSALLAFPIGPMTLTFSVPLELLMNQLDVLRSMTRTDTGPEPKKH